MRIFIEDELVNRGSDSPNLKKLFVKLGVVHQPFFGGCGMTTIYPQELDYFSEENTRILFYHLLLWFDCKIEFVIDKEDTLCVCIRKITPLQ